MKRLNLMLFALLALLCAASPVLAASTDTFQITITCNFISINLRNNADDGDYTTWAIGQKAENTATTMAQADGIKVVNTANVATDLSAWVSTPAADWTNGAAAGSDVYKLELKAFDATQATPDLSSGTTTIDTTSTAGNVFKAGLAATTDQFVYGKFTTPNPSTSAAQQTITVTVLSSPAA